MPEERDEQGQPIASRSPAPTPCPQNRYKTIALKPWLNPSSTETMDIHQRAHILGALANIQDTETRKSVATLAQSLVTKNLDGWERVSVLDALAAIQYPEERQSFVTTAQNLFTPNMTGHDRFQIIDHLNRLRSPRYQRRRARSSRLRTVREGYAGT